MGLNRNAKKRILITLLIGLILIIGFYLIANMITTYTGFTISNGERTSQFENCLQEQDLALYINSGNADSALKGLELFDYLQFFKIKNCFRDSSVCENNNIINFPTFVINGNKISKDISLSELEGYSGCAFK